MPGASQIIIAKLIAHDPDDIVRARHVRHFGDFKRPDAAMWNSQLQAGGRRKSGLSLVLARFLHANRYPLSSKTLSRRRRRPGLRLRRALGLLRDRGFAD